jgi:hypothetical protein
MTGSGRELCDNSFSALVINAPLSGSLSQAVVDKKCIYSSLTLLRSFFIYFFLSFSVSSAIIHNLRPLDKYDAAVKGSFVFFLAPLIVARRTHRFTLAIDCEQKSYLNRTSFLYFCLHLFL